MNPTTRGTVLISGASIAGPALAHWLHRYGYTVTVVEKADTTRGGGYPVDVRGTAMEVARRMGIASRLRHAHVDTRRMTFLDAAGDRVASVEPDSVTGGAEDHDVEVRRGDLTEILYRAVPDDVEFVFGDSIDTLTQHADAVDVSFVSGTRRRFDLVIGADGLHSLTRELVFGPERRFHRYLGYCFAGFTMPNLAGLRHEGVVWNVPGRAAVQYAVRDGEQLHGLLAFVRPQPPLAAFRDPRAQRELVATVFADDGWQTPTMVAAMRRAEDLFFDVVSQIRMPEWSRGRVALVGDAAYAPSFLTGQGSSLALVGAYMLAGSLASHGDHTAAFAAYERDVRGFVELNQDQVGRSGTTLLPVTAEDLADRNRRLRNLATPSAAARPAPSGRPAHTALRLPDFTG